METLHDWIYEDIINDPASFTTIEKYQYVEVSTQTVCRPLALEIPEEG